MEGVNERQMQIITKLNKMGFVKAVDLCEEFNVSSVTIRKDLNFLEKKGILLEGNLKKKLKIYEMSGIPDFAECPCTSNKFDYFCRFNY